MNVVPLDSGPVVTPRSIASWIDLQRMQQEEADRQLARSLTPLLYGASPETTMAEVPATPPVNVRSLQPGEDPEAAAMIPTVPGQPAQQQTISGHTPASLAQAVGGQANFATLARTREGQNAINFMQPVSPEELERRQRRAQGLLDFRRHSADERERYKLGDIEGGALAHMAAMRAMMDSVDDPTKITPQYERATDRWKNVRASEEQKGLAAQDMKTITEAQEALTKNPDDPAPAMRYVTALMTAKSAYARNLAGHLLPEAFKHAEARAHESRMMNAFNQVWGDIAQNQQTAQAKGITPNLERLSQDALQRHPQEATFLQSRAWLEPRKVPDFFWRVLFPGISTAAPKTDRELAQRTVETDPVNPLREGQPGYWEAVTKRFEAMERNRRMSPEDQAVNTQLRQARVNAQNALAEARKQGAAAKGGLKPDSINNLTLSINRLKEFRGSPALSEDDRLHVDQQIADIQSVLDTAIAKQRNPLGAAAPGGGAAAAPGAPGQTWQKRRIPKVGGKTVEVTEPPPADADQTSLEQASVAEAQRLMKQYGLTKPQVIDALRRAGWDVE